MVDSGRVSNAIKVQFDLKTWLISESIYILENRSEAHAIGLHFI